MKDADFSHSSLAQSLQHIFERTERPVPWVNGGNLPWDDPGFSRRMLREHLDDTHGAASRASHEREIQLKWLWQALSLQSGMTLLDVTCGPGLYSVPLARRGLWVTGIDFSPAAIAYARDLARTEGVADRCTFREADVREAAFGQTRYDAALFLYGQLAVFPREEARRLLHKTVRALRPAGCLCLEILDQNRVDKTENTWWFTDDGGLWGQAPYVSLGERFWYEEEKLSCERYYTLHLETGDLDEILLCDQTYAEEEMTDILQEAGFSQVKAYEAWDGLALYDAEEWNVYVARA